MNRLPISRCGDCPLFFDANGLYRESEGRQTDSCEHPWASTAVRPTADALPDDCPLREAPLQLHVAPAMPDRVICPALLEPCPHKGATKCQDECDEILQGEAEGDDDA